MAMLGSNDVDQLNELTKQVQADPGAYCRWLSQGLP
jgi:hypothetical protein